jgi:5-methyltetrahydropteroyltriglutamate--homocysteine methyltransferase
MDETNFAMLCDARIVAAFGDRGDDPESLKRDFVRLINDSIRDRPASMSVCIHLCRGNYRSGWVAEGGYDPVAEYMFNRVEADEPRADKESRDCGDRACR